MPETGILTDDQQERARQMLQEISEKRPIYTAEEKRELKIFWLQKDMSPKVYLEKGEVKEYEQPFPPRNYTVAEFDLIKLIHGRIPAGASKQDAD